MSVSPLASATGLIAAVALAGVAALGQQAQPKEIAKAEATPQIARQVYAVRGASAKDLANILTMHFENETAFRAVPDTASNTLLLNGPKAALEDAANVLREIDRPARPVYVEILSLELAGKPTGEGAADAKQFDPSQLSGAAREVRSKVRELLQKGVLGSVKTVELTGLAGQSAQTQVTENRPVVIGVTGFAGGGLFGGGGRGGAGGGPGAGGPGAGGGPGGAGAPVGRTMTQSITYRNVGMSVQVKPEVGADGDITLDLHIENSRMRTPEGGVSVGTDEKGKALPAAEFINSTLQTRLKLRPGQIAVAEDTKAASKTGQGQTIILVSASTEQGGAKSGK